MSRPRSFVVAFVAAAALASAGTAGAYHTRFVADNCNINPPQPTPITREGSTTAPARATRAISGRVGAGTTTTATTLRATPRGSEHRGEVRTAQDSPSRSGARRSTSDGSFDQWGCRTVHGPYTAAAFKAGSERRTRPSPSRR
jgi:hypothetical protein